MKQITRLLSNPPDVRVWLDRNGHWNTNQKFAHTFNEEETAAHLRRLRHAEAIDPPTPTTGATDV